MSGTLMVQGTTSDAGKSALVTGICRVLHRRGIAVAPFKPQNMALNSAVTVDGREIGRAQAVQAQACGLDPHSDMNPVLLKPNSDTGSQVIIQGRVLSNMDARSYHAYKPVAMAAVMASYRRLAAQYDCVIVEGAGSPAEINLREGDIANMGFAEAADCPVVLVADIDRGGVFAHLVGTLELLSDSERARVRGLVINRFRGDVALLQPGNDWVAQKTGKPVLGVLPYLMGLHLEAEDAVPTGPQASGGQGMGQGAGQGTGKSLRVIAPVFPRISNHTDFDALRLHPQVAFSFVCERDVIPGADLIVLPGSKSVRDDIEWLRRNGWVEAIERHLRYGGRVIGICGGFQMLGRVIADPDGIEGAAGEAEGLGLFDMRTVLMPEKRLERVRGTLLAGAAAAFSTTVSGYEIHMGVSSGPAMARPAVRFDDGHADGAISADGCILGTYLHGVFDEAAACRALLEWAGLKSAVAHDYLAAREAGIDRMADAVEAHLDVKTILSVLGRS